MSTCVCPVEPVPMVANDYLIDDTLMAVFQKLDDGDDIHRCRLVCRRWNAMISESLQRCYVEYDGRAQRSYLVDFPDIEHGPYLERRPQLCVYRGTAYLGRRRGWSCVARYNSGSVTFSISHMIGEFVVGPYYEVEKTSRGWHVAAERRLQRELHVAQQFDYYENGTILRVTTPDTADPHVTVRYDRNGQWNEVSITRNDEDESCAIYYNGERPTVYALVCVNDEELRCWAHFDRNGVISVMKVYKGERDSGALIPREMIIFHDNGRVSQRYFHSNLDASRQQYEAYDVRGVLRDRRMVAANARPEDFVDRTSDNVVGPSIDERLHDLPPVPLIPSPVPPVPLHVDQILGDDGRPRRAPALETLEGHDEFRDLLETLGRQVAPALFTDGPACTPTPVRSS